VTCHWQGVRDVRNVVRTPFTDSGVSRNGRPRTHTDVRTAHIRDTHPCGESGVLGATREVPFLSLHGVEFDGRAKRTGCTRHDDDLGVSCRVCQPTCLGGGPSHSPGGECAVASFDMAPGLLGGRKGTEYREVPIFRLSFPKNRVRPTYPKSTLALRSTFSGRRLSPRRGRGPATETAKLKVDGRIRSDGEALRVARCGR